MFKFTLVIQVSSPLDRTKTHSVSEFDTVEFIRVRQQFRSERGGDELRLLTELVNHVGHRLPVLRVQRLINLIEQVERCRVFVVVIEKGGY